jgi:hypothetical protein
MDLIVSNTEINNKLNFHRIKVDAIILVDLELNETSSKSDIKIIHQNKTKTKIKDDINTFFSLCLRAKDLCRISDIRWTMLCKLLEPYILLSTIHYMRVEREKFKSFYLPQTFPNDFGYYFKIEDKIMFHLNRNYNRFLSKQKVLRIFLAGDKTNVCRLQSFFIFWFSFVDEFDRAKAASETYTLGVFDVKTDNYKTLKLALKEIVNECRDLKFINFPFNENEIQTTNDQPQNEPSQNEPSQNEPSQNAQIQNEPIQNEPSQNEPSQNEPSQNVQIQNEQRNTQKYLKIPIEYHLGGDHAFINAERGLLSCASNHPCFTCTTHVDDFFKSDILLNDDNKRSLKMAESCISKKKEKKGFENAPIFDFIDFDMVHHDPLHEKIRIPNTILGLIFFDVMKHDLKNSKNLDDLPNQKAFFEWLEEIGIKKAFKVKSADSKATDPNFMIRDFTGSENEKICSLINSSAFPSIKNGSKYSKLLNDYYRLSKGYRAAFYLNNTELFKSRLNSWHQDFNDLFHKSKNTVYIHRFVTHLATDIKTFGNIDVYNCEG